MRAGVAGRKLTPPRPDVPTSASKLRSLQMTPVSVGAHTGAAALQVCSQWPLQWPVVRNPPLSSWSAALLQGGSLQHRVHEQCRKSALLRGGGAVCQRKSHLRPALFEQVWSQVQEGNLPASGIGLYCGLNLVERRQRGRRRLSRTGFAKPPNGVEARHFPERVESRPRKALVTSLNSVSIDSFKTQNQSTSTSAKKFADAAPESSTSHLSQSPSFANSYTDSGSVQGLPSRIANSPIGARAETSGVSIEALRSPLEGTSKSEGAVSEGEGAVSESEGGVSEVEGEVSESEGAVSESEGAVSERVNGGESCSTSLAEHREKYWKGLIDTENWEALHLDRAGSVTDSHVLRRKGHLKEQDGLIDFIISMHQMLSPYEVMEKVDQWVLEHRQDYKRSTLKRLVPSVGKFYTRLKLVNALKEYDEFASLSRRRYVPPNFAEIRHILNIAQLHASAEALSLITFDADGTLYADGHHMKDDNKMIGQIVKLMKRGISVAIVTAAGYPGEAARFEGRLAGLLAAFEALELPPETTKLFHVMGGECNYLLEVNERYRLEFVDDALWKLESMLEWREGDVERLLDDAETILRSASARLRVPVAVIRKERAVGICPEEPTIYEVLEEIALTVQAQLVDSKLPFCAFNGGKDVFVDVGNKSLGMAALMQYLQKRPEETLHVGDRFTVTGNDGATRSRCSILWVANPEETAFFVRMLLRDIHLSKLTPYLE